MTREEAINLMSQMIKDGEGFLSDYTLGAEKMGLEALKNQREWIPVSERLPEEEQEVYCQLSDGSNAVLYVQDNWGQMEWVDGMMGTGTYDVVAWREKPEPYKAESEVSE